jgi:site-specific DNA recombinase
VAHRAGRADQDRQDRLEQRHHLGDAPQPGLRRQAAYGKSHTTGAPVRATRQARLRGQRSARVSREHVPPEEWNQIPVPALVTAEQFELVQQRLERNQRISPRNTKRPSLLEGLLVCRHCGYAYYRCSTRSKNGILREYYRCSGTDGPRRPQGGVCENRPSAWQRSTSSSGLECSDCWRTRP